MKRSRKRKVRNTKNLDFQRLEPRQLLAGDFAGPHQVAASTPAGSNLVVNGDFESFADGVDQGEDNFYTQDQVTGWLAVDEANGQELNILNYQGYDNVIDLDSTENHFDRIYQNVDTEANTDYVITFDFRAHTAKDQDASLPTLTDRTNDFQVWFEGVLVGEFSPSDFWETGTITVTTNGSGNLSELLFCEIEDGPNNQGDSRGAFLDNIRMFRAVETSLVDNGSFEVTSNESTTFFVNDDVEAWTAVATDDADRLIKIINNNDTEVDTTAGDQYLNLDTQPEHRDVIYQDIATTAGATYLLKFNYRTDGLQDPDNIETIDEFRVRWIAADQDGDGVNGWAGTFSSAGDWQSVALILTANSDNTRLMFLEPSESNGGDGSGALIDDIQLMQIQSNELGVDLNGTEEGNDGIATYVPGVGSQSVVSNVALSNPSADRLTSVTVTLDGVVDGSDEVIGVVESLIPTNESGDPVITVNSFDQATRQLVLSGETTLANYQTVLSTLSYFNGADTVSTSNRTITVETTDTNLSASPTASATIDIAIEVDQPAIDAAIIEKFIADSGLTSTVTNTGLHVVIEEPGSGLNPTINDNVRVKYTGRFLELNDENQIVEGATFDASSDAGATFPLSGVIQGWQEGIPFFQTGGFGKLVIPSAIAYGPSGNGSIPPNSVLIFDVELLQII